VSADVVGKLCEIFNRTRRKAQSHASKRRKADSTSASVAKRRRCA
jgi:hypothetical protein